MSFSAEMNSRYFIHSLFTFYLDSKKQKKVVIFFRSKRQFVVNKVKEKGIILPKCHLGFFIVLLALLLLLLPTTTTPTEKKVITNYQCWIKQHNFLEKHPPLLVRVPLRLTPKMELWKQYLKRKKVVNYSRKSNLYRNYLLSEPSENLIKRISEYIHFWMQVPYIYYRDISYFSDTNLHNLFKLCCVLPCDVKFEVTCII